MFKNLTNISFAFLLMTGLPAVSQKKGGSAALPVDKALRTGKLENGFTYYIRKNTEPEKRVVMYLAIKAGSVLEDESQQGLAHFMEHMSFNGTTHFPKNQLVDYLQKAGVRFGADLNAYTGFDETVYQLPIPSDNKELLKNGLQIMRDWAQEAILDPAEIDKERGVILEEQRLRLGAEQRMQRQFLPVILNGSRYAFRMPIGQEKVLKSFEPQTIRQFYQDWYRPDLQALIVVGDIDVATMERDIIAKFSDLKMPSRPRYRTEYRVPLTRKDQFLVVTDHEMTQTVVNILIKHPKQKLQTEDDYRSIVMRHLFNGMLAARFSEFSLHQDPAFLQGHAKLDRFMAGIDAFSTTVVVKSGAIEQGVKAVWTEVQRVKQKGFTEAELSRQKTAYMSHMELAISEKDKTSSEVYVNEYLRHFLEDEAVPGIESEYVLLKKYLADISLQDVNGFAKQCIERNRDIIVMAPDKERMRLPDVFTMNKWLEEIERLSLDNYNDVISSNPLISSLPLSGKVIEEKKDERLGVTRLRLSNGLKVTLKPTSFKNDEIVFTGISKGGTSLYSDADFPSASSAANIIASSGVGDFNAVTLPKMLVGKQLRVMPFMNERSEGIKGRSTSKDLESTLQLVHLYFTAPRKDSTIFNNLILQSRHQLVNRENDPMSVFGDTIAAVLGKHNIRRTGPSLAKLEQMNLDRAYAIYKERFANARDFSFTFTGSFDTVGIRPLLEKYLGSLPSSGIIEEPKDLHLTAPEGIIRKEVLKGTERKATVQIVINGKYAFNQENTIRLQALKEILQLRLLERLRETEGGVYTPSVALTYVKLPHAVYSFRITFGCAPDNAEKLIASTMDEIAKLRDQGPPPDDLEKFVAEEKTTLDTDLKSNSFWLNYLLSTELDGEDPAQLFSIPSMLNKLNVETVRDAARQYLHERNVITFMLLPEKS